MITNYMNYGALSAKVRALYGKRLRFADFEHMASLKSAAEVLEYLRLQQGWSAAVAALGSAGYVGRVELEAALQQQRWKEYAGLSHFVPRGDRLLVSFPVREAELRSIMSTLRRLKSGGLRFAVTRPPMALEMELKVDRKALMACADYDGLVAATAGSIYHDALLHVRPDPPALLPDYTTTESLLRSTYFAHSYRIASRQYGGNVKRVLLRSLGEEVDLLNVIHILRLKTYFPGEDQYFSTLFPFNYKLRPDKIKALCDANDADEVLSLLADTHYAKDFQGVHVTELEGYYRRALYTFNKRQLVTGEPSAFTAIAYLHIKEMETQALINVIESVKYGVPYDEEFARLVGS